MPVPIVTALEAADLLSILNQLAWPPDVRSRMEALKVKLDHIARGIDVPGQIEVVTAQRDEKLAEAAALDAELATLVAEAAQLPPTADAGDDQRVLQDTPVTLDGSRSSDPNGDPLGYSWRQVAGDPVELRDPLSAICTFQAPRIAADVLLTFELTVSDGQQSSSDRVDVIVRVNAADVGISAEEAKPTP